MRFEAGDEIGTEFEERLTRALVAGPEPVIAVDFAARVAARVRSEGVPGAAGARRIRAGYGRVALYAALPVLMVVMVLLARFAGPVTAMTLGIEGLVVVEFVLVAVWLAMRPEVAAE